eukprot:CCRYP_006565-RA/>CCRYP_006565-RA protein AED:0.29 eAED:1.00 QI:0/-1/0/1/-1/0/1/0/38
MSVMTMKVNSNFTSKPYVNHFGSRVSEPVSRIHKRMLF